MNNLISAFIGALISVMILFNGTLSSSFGNYTSTVIIHIVGFFSIIIVLIISKSGIAERIVPNSIPALDSAAILVKAPNSALVGFVAATITSVLASILLDIFAKVLIVPPVVQLFFAGGAAGIFGNSTGGKKGAILGGIIQGIFLTVLPMFFAAEVSTFIKGNVTMAEPDFCWIGIILGKILKLFK